LDEALSHEKSLGRYLREAFVTTPWGRFGAQFVIVRPHHLTLSVTDWQVLMKRVYDRCIGQGIPDLPYQIVTKKKSVLEMDYVGPVGGKKFVKILCENVFIT
jgi:hypothetical protein